MIVSAACVFVVAAIVSPQPTSTPPAFRIPTATVRRAYVYPNQPTWAARPGKKLVAIDVDFGNFDSGLDLDDVMLVDAATGDSLGAAPEAAFLNADGTFHSWRKVAAGGRMRTLLIFEIPAAVQSVRLKLWGDKLTQRPVRLAPSGPVLPARRPGR